MYIKRNAGFDALRIIAAIFILIENIPFGESTPKALLVLIASDYMLLLGKVAVEILLILSGYFYTLELMKMPPSKVGGAVFQRLLRLLPLMWVTALLGSLLFDAVPWLSLLTATYNYVSAEPGYHDPFLPLWTLCVIAQFTVLWAIPFLLGVSDRTIKTLAIGWILVAFIVGISLDIYDTERFMNWNYKSVLTRGTGLCVGALIALMPPIAMARKKLFWTGIYAWLMAVLAYNANVVMELPIPFTLVQTGLSIAAFCIIRALWNWEPKSRTTVIRLASYTFALYVVEYPIMTYIFGAKGELWSGAQAIVCVLLLGGGAVLMVWCVERPIAKWYKPKSLHKEASGV